jgi:hypothetical protein
MQSQQQPIRDEAREVELWRCLGCQDMSSGLDSGLGREFCHLLRSRRSHNLYDRDHLALRHLPPPGYAAAADPLPTGLDSTSKLLQPKSFGTEIISRATALIQKCHYAYIHRAGTAHASATTARSRLPPRARVKLGRSQKITAKSRRARVRNSRIWLVSVERPRAMAALLGQTRR